MKYSLSIRGEIVLCSCIMVCPEKGCVYVCVSVCACARTCAHVWYIQNIRSGGSIIGKEPGKIGLPEN